MCGGSRSRSGVDGVSVVGILSYDRMKTGMIKGSSDRCIRRQKVAELRVLEQVQRCCGYAGSSRRNTVMYS